MAFFAFWEATERFDPISGDSMMTAPHEPQPRPVSQQSLAPASRPPQAPIMGEPPPPAEAKEDDHATEEPGYGFGV